MEPLRPQNPFQPTSDASLFRLAIGRVILFGYREEDEWVLSRGWRNRDRFSDIRRWRFTVADHFVTQVSRLVRDAGFGDDFARAAEVAAVEWATAPHH